MLVLCECNDGICGNAAKNEIINFLNHYLKMYLFNFYVCNIFYIKQDYFVHQLNDFLKELSVFVMINKTKIH